jgi:hypothetical protein
MVSTKTVALATDPGELRKNLSNRWEEFDGDLKNLRGRFPLAVIGALVIVPATTVGKTLPAFVDMMTKLTASDRPWENAYNRATIVVADWGHRSVDRVPLLNQDLDESQLPAELQPEFFFDALPESLFRRSPIDEHESARVASAAARGEDPAAIERSAELTGENDDQEEASDP